MELICPVCNGLYTKDIKCDKCSRDAIMKDKGRLTDYYDNYSPYLPMELTNKVDGIYSENKCFHLYKCDSCGYDKRIVIDKITP